MQICMEKWMDLSSAGTIGVSRVISMTRTRPPWITIPWTPIVAELSTWLVTNLLSDSWIVMTMHRPLNEFRCWYTWSDLIIPMMSREYTIYGDEDHAPCAKAGLTGHLHQVRLWAPRVRTLNTGESLLSNYSQTGGTCDFMKQYKIEKNKKKFWSKILKSKEIN